jgi:glutamyl-tRNA reductase
MGKEAYLFLLETICGLKSKLIGENEIVGQFKLAFKEFIAKENKDKRLIRILEKLFKDAKEIRTDYLLGLSQKTYASITRKHICNSLHADKVLILGSGTLAEDLINQFKKYTKVYISARNTERVAELADLHDLEVVPWLNRDHIAHFSFIANTVGTICTILEESFFTTWTGQNEKRFFVDLGSPSSIKTNLTLKDGVMKLDDIFQEGAVHEKHKLNQINKAKYAMSEIVEKRILLFTRRLHQRSQEEDQHDKPEFKPKFKETIIGELTKR